MNNDKIVSILIDDIEVEGIITHRSSSDIDVEIVKPFCNLSKGCHIPYFARPNHSFDSAYGDDTAKNLLKELYNIGKNMNINRLNKKLSCVQNKIDNLSKEMMSGDKFNEELKKLKKRFKSNEIDNKEYQKELIILRKKQEQFELETSKIMDSFFEDSFPMVVPHGTREEVLDIIKGNKCLTIHST